MPVFFVIYLLAIAFVFFIAHLHDTSINKVRNELSEVMNELSDANHQLQAERNKFSRIALNEELKAASDARELTFKETRRAELRIKHTAKWHLFDAGVNSSPPSRFETYWLYQDLIPDLDDAYRNGACEMREAMAVHLISVARRENVPLNRELAESQFPEAFADSALKDAVFLLCDSGHTVSFFAGGAHVVVSPEHIKPL